MQTTKHAIAAGLGAPVRLCPDHHHIPSGDPQGLSAQEETAGHHYSTTAVIENQHLDFGGVAQALQLHNIMAALPALVDRFGCGVAHDLAHMDIGELAGLYSRLKAMKGSRS
jgi:hypothetical protein